MYDVGVAFVEFRPQVSSDVILEDCMIIAASSMSGSVETIYFSNVEPVRLSLF